MSGHQVRGFFFTVSPFFASPILSLIFLYSEDQSTVKAQLLQLKSMSDFDTHSLDYSERSERSQRSGIFSIVSLLGFNKHVNKKVVELSRDDPSVKSVEVSDWVNPDKRSVPYKQLDFVSSPLSQTKMFDFPSSFMQGMKQGPGPDRIEMSSEYESEESSDVSSMSESGDEDGFPDNNGCQPNGGKPRSTRRSNGHVSRRRRCQVAQEARSTSASPELAKATNFSFDRWGEISPEKTALKPVQSDSFVERASSDEVAAPCLRRAVSLDDRVLSKIPSASPPKYPKPSWQTNPPAASGRRRYKSFTSNSEQPTKKKTKKA